MYLLQNMFCCANRYYADYSGLPHIACLLRRMPRESRYSSADLNSTMFSQKRCGMSDVRSEGL